MDRGILIGSYSSNSNNQYKLFLKPDGNFAWYQIEEGNTLRYDSTISASAMIISKDMLYRIIWETWIENNL